MSVNSSAAINPATLVVLDNYIATGTQLKVERPGKAAAITPCDSIDGPIVKLNDGTVIRLDTEHEAKKYVKEVAEILYLGDFLVSYGDFYDRNHVLVPPGYCEEWHNLEVGKALASAANPEAADLCSRYLSIKFPSFPSASDAVAVSRLLDVPLHPRYTYFWGSIPQKSLLGLFEWLKSARISDSKLIFPNREEKRIVELLGIPHKVSGEFVVVEKDD